MVGPFGTIENPVLIPAIHQERVAGCTGGTGECDQIFMHVRVMYELPDGSEIDPIDPDVNDVFDIKLLEKGHQVWNATDMKMWPVGQDAMEGTVYGGAQRTEPQKELGE